MRSQQFKYNIDEEASNTVKITRMGHSHKVSQCCRKKCGIGKARRREGGLPVLERCQVVNCVSQAAHDTLAMGNYGTPRMKQEQILDGSRIPKPDICSQTTHLLALRLVQQNCLARDSCRGLASGSTLRPALRRVRRSSLTGRREGGSPLERAVTLVSRELRRTRQRRAF